MSTGTPEPRTKHRKALRLTGLIAAVVVVVPLSLVGLLTVMRLDWATVPRWAQTNTGPWIVLSAAIAAVGVGLTIWHQHSQAERERVNAASRSLNEWLREKTYEEAGQLLDLVRDFEIGRGDQNPHVFEEHVSGPILRLVGLVPNFSRYEPEGETLLGLVKYRNGDMLDPDTALIPMHKLWYLGDMATDVIRGLRNDATPDWDPQSFVQNDEIYEPGAFNGTELS